ncbi:MAG: hypothetical protein M1823_004513 [Watsoniomyces obsoletus]|nr:MAG: hypothetical protein M1823_004513 [Watsoniomyces obsoletus]
MQLQTVQDPATQNWEAFRNWILQSYGATDPKLSAEVGMGKMRYRSGQSIRSFINEFENHLIDLDWNDSAITARFREKLPEHILRRINAGHFSRRPETYNEYKQAAITADNNIMLEREERSVQEQSVPYQKRVRFDLDGPTNRTPLALGNPNLMSTSGRRGLSSQERQRRIQNNLCNYCGQAGHYVRNCPSKANANLEERSGITGRQSPTTFVPTGHPKNTSPRRP